jgi:hypothetical protein
LDHNDRTTGEPRDPTTAVGGWTAAPGTSGEAAVTARSHLGCVECHMPAVRRALVEGGPVRASRRHLWRGGHDPAMVRKALSIEFSMATGSGSEGRSVILTLTNTGAAHYVPTGTPDRHLSVTFRLLTADGRSLREQQHLLKRRVMWRPFIVDLWDNRLSRGEPRRYVFDLSDDTDAAAVEATVRYGLLEESRRQRIGYANKEPVSFEVFRKRLVLRTGSTRD